MQLAADSLSGLIRFRDYDGLMTRVETSAVGRYTTQAGRPRRASLPCRRFDVLTLRCFVEDRTDALTLY